MAKIQQIFHYGWDAYCSSFQPDDVQQKSGYSIMNCRTGKSGYNISSCSDCGYTDFHVVFTIPACAMPEEPLPCLTKVGLSIFF